MHLNGWAFGLMMVSAGIMIVFTVIAALADRRKRKRDRSIGDPRPRPYRSFHRGE